LARKILSQNLTKLDPIGSDKKGAEKKSDPKRSDPNGI